MRREACAGPPRPGIQLGDCRGLAAIESRPSSQLVPSSPAAATAPQPARHKVQSAPLNRHPSPTPITWRLPGLPRRRKPRPDPVASWRAMAYPNWAVGRTDGAGLLLPVGEEAVAVGSGVVVSILNAPVGATNGRSTIVVRDLADGHIRWQRSRPEALDGAVIASNWLYVTGQNATRTDPGLLRYDLATGAVTRTVKPASWPADWPGPGTRGQVLVSRSGRTVGSPVCGAIWNVPPHCWIDLVDVASGRVTRPMADIPDRPWVISDDTILARRDYPQRLVAYDARTGRVRWSVPGLASSGYVASDAHPGRHAPATGRAALPTLDTRLRDRHSDRALARADLDGPNCGRPRHLVGASTDTTVAVGEVPLDQALNSGVEQATAERIDLTSGHVLAGPLTITSDFRDDQCPGTVAGRATGDLALPARRIRNPEVRHPDDPEPVRLRPVADAGPADVLRAGAPIGLAGDRRTDRPAAQQRELVRRDGPRGDERRHRHVRGRGDVHLVQLSDDRRCPATRPRQWSARGPDRPLPSFLVAVAITRINARSPG